MTSSVLVSGAASDTAASGSVTDVSTADALISSATGITAVVSTGRTTTAGVGEEGGAGFGAGRAVSRAATGGTGPGFGAGRTVSREATGGGLAAARPPLVNRPGTGVTIRVAGRTTVSAGARAGARDVSRRVATGGGVAAGGPGTGGAGVTATRAIGAEEDMNRT